MPHFNRGVHQGVTRLTMVSSHRLRYSVMVMCPMETEIVVTARVRRVIMVDKPRMSAVNID